MKRLLLAAVLFCSLTPFAHADDATKRAKVDKLMTAMHADKMIDQMMGAIKAQSAQMFQGMPGMDQLNDKQKAIMAEFQGKLMDVAMSGVSWAKLEPIMRDVYVKTFTEDEIDGMVTFYSSPVGQSVLEKMPLVMQNSMSQMQGMMGDVMPKIQALAEDYGKRIKDAGDKPTP